ncbi:MAG: YHS domain-containing protein, partial [Rhodospirillaceae bacterium]|nr:YHS domain-containing protein [Rhodospirillaceae bacterium]
MSETMTSDTLTSDSIVKDPVCGMDVDPAATAHHADHAGVTYHFCSAGCVTKFTGDPEHYLLPPD